MFQGASRVPRGAAALRGVVKQGNIGPRE